VSAPRTKALQAGSIYEKHGAFHVRFYAYENEKRVQRSKKLCAVSEEHPAKDHPSVLALAEDFIRGLNAVNGENAADCGHKCPICHQRCKRTIRGNFAKKVKT